MDEYPHSENEEEKQESFLVSEEEINQAEHGLAEILQRHLRPEIIELLVNYVFLKVRSLNSIIKEIANSEIIKKDYDYDGHEISYKDKTDTTLAFVPSAKQMIKSLLDKNILISFFARISPDSEQELIKNKISDFIKYLDDYFMVKAERVYERILKTNRPIVRFSDYEAKEVLNLFSPERKTEEMEIFDTYVQKDKIKHDKFFKDLERQMKDLDIK